MNKKLLLSEEEHRAIGKYSIPYIYTIESDSQILYYFGSKHTYDPSHPQFNLLQKKWQEFLQKTSGAKSIVIFEGNVNLDSVTTLKEVIEKYGESGAIVFYANQAHVQSIRPEPTIKDEADILLKDFPRDEIFYFYMIRGIVSWQRAVMRKEFDEFIKLNIKYYKDVLGWLDFNFSFETIRKTHRQIFGKEFDLDNKDFITKIPSPIREESKINEIARMSSTIRNMAILDCVENYWQKEYNIFVVYGASHAVMQEQAIKSLA